MKTLAMLLVAAVTLSACGVHAGRNGIGGHIGMATPQAFDSSLIVPVDYYGPHYVHCHNVWHHGHKVRVCG